MAGVISASQIRGQFAAIAELRWNLFRNSLRTRRGKAELVSRIIIGLFFGVFGLGGSVGFGSAAWYFVSEHKLEWLAVLLWPIFFFWQFFPVVVTAFTENLESSHLLRFPLSYRSYFLVRLAYGLFDPATSVGCLWLFGITIGIAAGDFRLLPAVMIVLLSFAAVNVLLTRVVFSWVERWLAQRRTREIFGILIFLALISFQLIGPLIERFSQRQLPGVVQFGGRVSIIQRALPPGLAAESIASAYHGEIPMAALWLIALGGYGVALVWLLNFRLRAQYAGENLSEAQAVASSRAELRPLPLGWKLPIVSGPVTAVIEKELRILARSAPMLLTMIMPIVAMFVLRVGRWSSGAPGGHGGFLHSSDFGFPVGSIYALLMLTNLVYNSFGAEGYGVQFFLFSPVRLQEVVLGKNLVHAACLAGEIVLVWMAVNFAYGMPALAMTAATVSALLFAAPVNFAAGNLFSIYSPKKVDYGIFGRQKASQMTILASFGIQLFIFAVSAGTVFLVRHYGSIWLATPIFLFLAIFTSGAYLLVLNRVDQMVSTRREIMVLELGKP